MAKKKSDNSLGSWAFLVGVILAVVLGLIGSLNPTWIWILVIIGLIVGLLNVTGSEMGPFLLAGAVLIIASEFGGDALGSVRILDNVLQALLVLFVPATIIVAIKHVFSLARN